MSLRHYGKRLVVAMDLGLTRNHEARCGGRRSRPLERLSVVGWVVAILGTGPIQVAEPISRGRRWPMPRSGFIGAGPESVFGAHQLNRLVGPVPAISIRPDDVPYATKQPELQRSKFRSAPPLCLRQRSGTGCLAQSISPTHCALSHSGSFLVIAEDLGISDKGRHRSPGRPCSYFRSHDLPDWAIPAASILTNRKGSHVPAAASSIASSTSSTDDQSTSFMAARIRSFDIPASTNARMISEGSGLLLLPFSASLAFNCSFS